MQAILKTKQIVGLRPQRFIRNRQVCSCWKWAINKDCNYITLSNYHTISLSRTLCAGNFDLNSKQYHLLHTKRNDLILHRDFSYGFVLYDKPSSKIEEAVQSIKEKQDDKPKDVEVKKKTVLQRVKDEIIHYYHGFRLLFIDFNISRKLLWRVLKGNTLTRREYNLLQRATGDFFRLIPFSVFIIVPFMEFLLPFFIKFFPGMLPSTFETTSEKEDKNRKNLKVKLEMAKFLQHTLDQMAPQSSERHSDLAADFKEFFVRVRSSGELASNEEILKFSKLFEDEITLDSLQRPQLVALCRVLDVTAIGTNPMLRFNLRMKLRTLAVDDKMIAKEGVESLTLNELQTACRSRGMRAYGMPEERLRLQLRHWLDLSLNKKVPPSLLLLSRALMIPENVPTGDKLKATISALPENIVNTTTAAIAEKEGKHDNKAKIEALREEVRKVIEEREEIKKSKEEVLDKAPFLSAAKTTPLVDKAPIITSDTGTSAAAKSDDGISAQDIDTIEDALDAIAKQKKKLFVEREEIEELKEEMAEYQEDVQELQEVSKKDKSRVRETKGAKRLSKMVNSMITKMDTVLEDLHKEEKKLKQNLEVAKEEEGKDLEATQEQLVHVNELMLAIKKIRNVPNDSKVAKFQELLNSMDDDFDGQLKVDELLKVIETIGQDDVNLTGKQMSEILDLLDKEEMLSTEEKIQKALNKGMQQENAAKAEKKQTSNSANADSVGLNQVIEPPKQQNATSPPTIDPSKTIPPIPAADPKQKPKEKSV